MTQQPAPLVEAGPGRDEAVTGDGVALGLCGADVRAAPPQRGSEKEFSGVCVHSMWIWTLCFGCLGNLRKSQGNGVLS